MRVLAIDYGDRRTGLAFSDLTATLCGEAIVVESFKTDLLIERIVAEIKAREVSEIVLGLPKNMDGTEGERAIKCREFGKMIEEASGIKVTMWDERRSSVEAHNILRSNGKKEKKHKKTVDAVAASLILDGYLRK